MANTTDKIVLPKGERIKFLDYEIANSLNNDGLVLMKNRLRPRELYETHLGNYGTGTQANIDYCKRDAILYFMAARPDTFATAIVNKIANRGGTYHEYFLPKSACKEESVLFPEDEITAGGGINCMIYYKGKPLDKYKK